MDYSGTFVAFVSDNPDDIAVVKKLLLSARDALNEMEEEEVPVKLHTFSLRMLSCLRERWREER